MNFKESFEKDPARYRTLRQVERDIKAGLDKANVSLSAARSEIKQLHDQRGHLKDDEKNLSIQILAATALSGGRGAIGHVISGGASHLTTQREVLKSRINALQSQKNRLKTRTGGFESDRSRLESSLSKNAGELGALNCVV